MFAYLDAVYTVYRWHELGCSKPVLYIADMNLGAPNRLISVAWTWVLQTGYAVLYIGGMILLFAQDGFFDGELLDGRRGLVPSNFVEKLVGSDLVEFHQSVVMGLRDCDESMSTSVPQDLDYLSQDESQLMIGKLARNALNQSTDVVIAHASRILNKCQVHLDDSDQV